MSKNYKLTKKFPENFSDDIIDIVQVLTLRHGSVPFLYGSGSYKIAYPSDYDLAQEVPVTIGGKKNKLILKDLQYVIKGIMPMRNVYIGDIKSGEVPKFKVVEDDTTADNYPERRETMINKINDLYRKKHISAKEKKDSLALLQPNLGELDIYIIKHDIRFEVIRWTPQDILNGFVHYRGMKIKFEDYLYGDSITKIDVIAWLNGIRYNEVTMVYAFTTDETKDAIMLNKKFGNIELALLDQIPYLLHKGMYMKICKRINSIIRASETPDKNLLKKLYSLFVSDLGLLNQVISDIGVIEFLIENIENIPETRFEYEINQMKTRLGNMTNISYLKKQNVVIKLLDELQADIVNMKLLEELEAYLRGIMEPETKKIMKKWKLFPIPPEFLPTQFKGGKLSTKHLRDLLNASYAENPPNNIDDFILDKTLSTKHVKVYHNPQNEQTVIAHRGTKEWYDWGNNIIYGLFGKKGYKLTPRFKESERVHKATVAKYGVKNLSTIGHSQGGIASEILGQEGKEIITFNKATKPFGNVKGEKQHDISTTGDLVSKLNPFQGKSKKDISLISKTTNPVKEHLLGALEGLDEDTTFGEGGKVHPELLLNKIYKGGAMSDEERRRRREMNARAMAFYRRQIEERNRPAREKNTARITEEQEIIRDRDRFNILPIFPNTLAGHKERDMAYRLQLIRDEQQSVMPNVKSLEAVEKQMAFLGIDSDSLFTGKYKRGIYFTANGGIIYTIFKKGLTKKQIKDITSFLERGGE